MTALELKRDESLRMANAKRRRQALIKADLRTGRLSLSDVMSDPPPELQSAALIDLVRWTHSGGSRSRSVIEVGRLAVRDGVNLMVPLGEASVRSRAWVAENTGRYWRASAVSSSKFPSGGRVAA